MTTSQINLVKFSDVQFTSRVSSVYSTVHADPGMDVWCRSVPADVQFRLYDDIPHCTGVYVTGHDGHLLGRTILWKNVQECGTTRTFPAFSKIYAVNERVKGLIREYCHDRGGICLETLMGQPTCIRKDAPRLKVDMSFPAERNMFTWVPWVDYFHFAVEGSQFLFTHIPKGLDGHEDSLAFLHSSDGEGGFLTGHTKDNICHWCGTKFDPGDVIYYTPEGDAGCIFCIEAVTAE